MRRSNTATRTGWLETVSRYALTFDLKARWAREDILAAAWQGAMLGALSGFGGAMLCLVLGWRASGETAELSALLASRPRLRDGRKLRMS